MLVIKKPVNFVWDRGNQGKSWKKHQVSDIEAEEVFFDEDKKISRDELHSEQENRFIILGKIKTGRLFFVVFTIRDKKIRIISARDLIGRGVSCMKKKFKIPKFKNEDEERDFWAGIDLSEYFESSDFESVSFPNLKPTSRSISIRIPEYILNRIKEKANEINVPYQSLIKGYLKKAVFGSSQNP